MFSLFIVEWCKWGSSLTVKGAFPMGLQAFWSLIFQGCIFVHLIKIHPRQKGQPSKEYLLSPSAFARDVEMAGSFVEAWVERWNT